MHHFGSKAELLVAAVRHLAEQRGANLVRAGRDPAMGARTSQAIDLLWETFTGPLFTATLELWVGARTDRSWEPPCSSSNGRCASISTLAMEHLFGDAIAARPAFAEASNSRSSSCAVRRSRRSCGPTARQQAVIERWKSVFTALIEEAV
jgi:AcrR family transcriptional regulator